MAVYAIGPPPQDLPSLLARESAILFPAFTANTAYALGTHLRSRLHLLTPTPCVVSIALCSAQLLFHACSHPGTTPDNAVWVARKQATALRWGVSSYYVGRKFGGDERKFREKYGMGAEEGGRYTIHGGAVPVRVEGAEGVVAVVVVSGLKQEEDHMVVVEGMEDCVLMMERSGGDEEEETETETEEGEA